ncbi:MAG: 2-hydroxyacid dehydrogenase [Rhizobiales bacterium]|nr:2-hydroxyacid dehydrogenase [Hyphomicrobiales bacterium]
MSKQDVLVLGGLRAETLEGLKQQFTTHLVKDAKELSALLARIGNGIRGAARGTHIGVDRAMMEQLPKLEIVANFGVGYDGIDTKAAAERGIIVTNTPDVLTEEVADTTLGLLLMTVRDLPAGERYLRAGKWPSGDFPLSKGSMRDRKVGMIGLGRIGLAIARRLDAMGVPVSYHTRNPRKDVPYNYYPDLAAMAEAVDTLIIIVPGTAETKGMVNAKILKALGPTGIVINVGRGVVIDEPALVEALKSHTIQAAGLDVFPHEPQVSPELLALDNTVLLPHLGSGSVFTRNAMGQLMIDNLVSWFRDGKPLTPVVETPWPRKA